MKSFLYLLIGIFFGIVLFKSEAASWFRIYEMFRFGSFHMYGIIGTAVGLGSILILGIKYFGLKTIQGKRIETANKEPNTTQYLIGGTIFGLGWALAGACPGPMYALLGAGFWPILIVLISSIVGTFLYGILRNKLPH